MFDFHSLTINGQRHFSVAGLVNGGFVTVYEDRVGGDLNCYYQIFDAVDYSPQGANILHVLSSVNNQIRPQVWPLSDGGFIAAWIDVTANEVNWRIFNTASFTPASNEKVITGSVADTGGLVGVCQISDGSFIATWIQTGVDA